MSFLTDLARYLVANFRHVWRFGAVGIATFAINFAVFSAFFGWMVLDYRIAVSLSYVVTVCCHFLLNKHFTFDAGSQNILRNTSRYALMLCMNYLITILASWTSVEFVGASPYFGVVASTAGTALSSFILMKYFVFNDVLSTCSAAPQRPGSDPAGKCEGYLM